MIYRVILLVASLFGLFMPAVWGQAASGWALSMGAELDWASSSEPGQESFDLTAQQLQPSVVWQTTGRWRHEAGLRFSQDVDREGRLLRTQHRQERIGLNYQLSARILSWRNKWALYAGLPLAVGLTTYRYQQDTSSSISLRSPFDQWQSYSLRLYGELSLLHHLNNGWQLQLYGRLPIWQGNDFRNRFQAGTAYSSHTSSEWGLAEGFRLQTGLRLLLPLNLRRRPCRLWAVGFDAGYPARLYANVLAETRA